MKTFFSGMRRVLLVLLPLFLGMAGLWGLAGEPVLDALFSCVSMYFLNYGDAPANLLVELARWLAPLTTASGILLALCSVRDRIRCIWLELTGGGVAVYGPEEARTRMTERLGRRGIAGTDQLLPARRYLLLGGGEDQTDLCRRILEKRPGAEVFLQCGEIRPQSATSPHLHLFSPEETAARLFWKEHCLWARSVECGHRLRIVLLGFGQLGENLLYYGLLDNIFDPKQVIEYHIFGGSSRFSAVHTQLDQIGDPVIFHREPWWDCLDLIRQAQLVLLLPQEGQAAAARDLLLAAEGPHITVFTGEGGAVSLLEEPGRLEVFSWLEAAMEPEQILQDTLLDRAKRINLRYAQLYGGAADTPQALEAEWEKLDAFTRYSNISCADYHEIRLQMLESLPSGGAELPPQTMELLAELEHIRWCRYHYLHNWSYAPETDAARRVHNCLVPFGELSEAEQRKDVEAIRSKLEE